MGKIIEPSVNRKYRDTVFRMLFSENKENAMSLYEAISGRKIEHPEDFVYTTLEDVIYMKMKNDTSFLVDSHFVLFEHQSTFNPNMPLRGLMYCAELYKSMYHNTHIYSSARLQIPTPEYVVFYNGKDKYFPDDRMELRLSDSFSDPSARGKFEWTATMININEGHNADIIKKCAVLEGYTVLVQKIVEYRRQYKIEDAVRLAMEYCINNGWLVEFLSKHMKEVFNMSLTEFDEKEYLEMVREEGIQEGRQEGRQEGIQEGMQKGRQEGLQEGKQKLATLINLLLSNNRIEEISRVTSDPVYCDQLLRQYSLA